MHKCIATIAIAVAAAIAPPLHADTKQIECLQRNVYWEARGESILGQILVARTTLNRVHDARWPNTICGVVYQKSQFSWTLHRSKRYSHPHETKAWELAGIVANQTLLDAALAKHDPSHGATFFHAHSVKPPWAARFTPTISHGGHIFYR